MSLDPKDRAILNRLIAAWSNLRGDNVRRTGDTYYIGSGPSTRAGGTGDNWQPRQYRVKSESNDYLTCQAYNTRLDKVSDVEVSIAKPPDMRGGTERWGVYPAYVPDVSVIWAAPLADNGAEDADGNPIVLCDLNFDGRSASGFWGRVTGNTADGTNKWTYAVTEQTQSASGFADLTDGRNLTGVLNTAEANNDGTGTQGNSIDIDGTVFDDNTSLAIQPVEGDPVVWVVRTYDTDGTALYAFQYENAVDGPCG